MNPRIKELAAHARATGALAAPPGLGAQEAATVGKALANAVTAQFALIRAEPPSQTAEAVRQRLYAAWEFATSEVRNQASPAAPRKQARPR